MDKTRLVYGIDLGTTYSCVAQVNEFDQAVVLRNPAGKATTPSVVYFDGDHIVVGDEAKNQLAEYPEKTVSFIKRHIGDDEYFKKPTKFPGGRDPVEISSLILRKLVKNANAVSGFTKEEDMVKDVVITCPAYFGTKEREQTKQAGILAGLNVLSIIDEPVAAAIAYGMKATDSKTVLVYDLGGGTFDVTVIRVDSGTITVSATDGDHRLGGVDWDTAVAEYLLSKYNDEHHTSLTLDADAQLKNALLLEIESKKMSLTEMPKVVARIEYNGVSSRVPLTRELFDQITELKLNETIDKTHEVLKTAKLDIGQIDEVLLVGGSSKMPQVKARVDREFGCDAKLYEPDESVAKGAAIYALNKSYTSALTTYNEDVTGDVKKPKTLNAGTLVEVVTVTSKTYGTDITGNKVKNLIFANTVLPAKATDVFTTAKDGQTGVSMKVFESDVTDKENDKVIEEHHARLLEDHALELNKPYPAKTKVPVIFEINREGILSVHAEVEHNVLDFTLKITGVRSEKELAETARDLQKLHIE